MQLNLFNEIKEPYPSNLYRNILTVSINRKGVLDIDTVKGCTLGMKSYPNGGCYSECYARKNAAMYGIDFTTSVSRKFLDREHVGTVNRLMNEYHQGWYRIGTAGDPCHDWENTVVVCRALRHTKKIPVIVTKHWIELNEKHLCYLKWLNSVGITPPLSWHR